LPLVILGHISKFSPRRLEMSGAASVTMKRSRRLVHDIILLTVLIATTFAPGSVIAREPVPPPPIFIPHVEFNFGDGGYYTTKEGRRYHFDRDDNRWHWGRTHNEGRREEERREKMEHRK
jgi:hypothetical protein